LWNSLAEEIFFFQYHLKMPMSESMNLPIILRKWMIERFIDQKKKEDEAMESAKRRSKSKK
jgi:hypothetical protein